MIHQSTMIHLKTPCRRKGSPCGASSMFVRDAFVEKTIIYDQRSIILVSTSPRHITKTHHQDTSRRIKTHHPDTAPRHITLTHQDTTSYQSSSPRHITPSRIPPPLHNTIMARHSQRGQGVHCAEAGIPLLLHCL